MSRSLADMIVIITGASSGIGKALAEHLSARGAKLILAARRIDRLRDLNHSLGGIHEVVEADVSLAGDCQHIIDRCIARFGRIDTLVCNAGYGLVGPVWEMTPQQMQAIFATNVLGATNCIRAAVPHMLEHTPRDGYRGHILIISSVLARRGLARSGAYSATKAAQLSLAEALRVELRPHNIAVTSVHPVGTRTEFFHAAEQRSHEKLFPPAATRIVQSADTVARKIAAAIQRPRPELWPLRPARWLLNLAVLSPRLADWLIARSQRGH